MNLNTQGETMEKSYLRFIISIPILLIVTFSQTMAQEKSHDPLLTEYMTVFEMSAEKASGLSEAIPDELYDWRPAEGVRSVREVVLHLAASNYMIAGMFGAELPQNLDLRNLEQSGMNKAEAVDLLSQSYKHVGEAIKAMDQEQLDKSVSFFGNDVSSRQAMLFLGNHVAEHLGQLVAYARTNNITPPWNR